MIPFMITKLFKKIINQKKLVKAPTRKDTTGEDLHTRPPYIYIDSYGKIITRPYIPSSFITKKAGL